MDQRKRDMALFLCRLPARQILLLLLGYVEKWPGISTPGDVLQEVVHLPPQTPLEPAVCNCRTRLLQGGVLDGAAFESLQSGRLDLTAELAVNICVCLLDPFEFVDEADPQTLEFNQKAYRKAQLRSSALLIHFLGPPGQQILQHCSPPMVSALLEAKTWAEAQSAPVSLAYILALLENCFHSGALDYAGARLLLQENLEPQSPVWSQLAMGLARATGHDCSAAP